MRKTGDAGSGAGSGRAPLSAGERAELEAARAALKPVDRAARWATMTLWTVGGFGILTVLWGLVSGGGGVVVGAALVAVAWNERRGRDRLRSLDPEGARILGWNQVVLGAVITAYLLAVIVRARTITDPSMQELEALVGLDPDLVADLTTLVYGATIVIVDVVQVFTARFHFARRAMVEAFRRDTPAWVTELLREIG